MKVSVTTPRGIVEFEGRLVLDASTSDLPPFLNVEPEPIEGWAFTQAIDGTWYGFRRA